MHYTELTDMARRQDAERGITQVSPGPMARRRLRRARLLRRRRRAAALARAAAR